MITLSVLFNEPKLLKLRWTRHKLRNDVHFSALQRAEIAEIVHGLFEDIWRWQISVLFNEPKLLKYWSAMRSSTPTCISVLFNEPKLLKSLLAHTSAVTVSRYFSALQRAEIAEISHGASGSRRIANFSALQRAEIAEISRPRGSTATTRSVFQCSSTSRNC